MNIFLPADPQAARTLQIQAEARVVRLEQVDRGEETAGFAVANQKMVVLRGSEVIDEWTPPRAKPNENEKYGRRSGGRDGDGGNSSMRG